MAVHDKSIWIAKSHWIASEGQCNLCSGVLLTCVGDDSSDFFLARHKFGSKPMDFDVKLAVGADCLTHQ